MGRSMASGSDSELHTQSSSETEGEGSTFKTALRSSFTNSELLKTSRSSIQPKCPINRSHSISERFQSVLQCFHFATGLVSFAWMLYFIRRFFYPSDDEDKTSSSSSSSLFSSIFNSSPGEETHLDDSIWGQISKLTFFPYFVVMSLMSIMASTLITGISYFVVNFYNFMPFYPMEKLSDFPKQYTNADPALHSLTHSQILEEARHNSMITETPYNYTSEGERIKAHAQELQPKNTESGLDFLDSFYLHKIGKFKKTLEEQQDVIGRIKARHEEMGLSTENDPRYMICTPCSDPFHCHRRHFKHNGCRYHCDPFDIDYEPPRHQMSRVKFYKDNDSFLETGEKKSRNDTNDLKGPNDFPGRNLQELLTKKFPPFSDDFDISRPFTRYEKRSHVQPQLPPIRQACPRDDPCIFCRAKYSGLGNVSRNKGCFRDCCGNRDFRSGQAEFDPCKRSGLPEKTASTATTAKGVITLIATDPSANPIVPSTIAGQFERGTQSHSRVEFC